MKVKAKRGFSLIEIIISVALLAILLIPISNVMIGTTKKNKDAEINNKVTTEAQKVLEELNSYDTLTFDSTGNFTMLNGQMTLHYDSVNDTISTVNPGIVNNNNDVINVSITGTKNTDFSRTVRTPVTVTTATATSTATTTTVAPDLTITSDGRVKSSSGNSTAVSNVNNGLIIRIANDYGCAVYDNNGVATASPFAGTNITMNTNHTYVINLVKGAADNGQTMPIEIYSEAPGEVKFIVNYQNGISDNTRVSINNVDVMASIKTSYNYYSEAPVIGNAYNFKVTATAKSPVSTELDSAGNKVKKTLKFSGETLKNIVIN